MDFYELKAFVSLTKNLHYGKTAEQLNMSPSALSRIINRLEEETHSILLDRNNRQVVLTKEGEIFQKYAVQILEKESELKDRLSVQSEEIEGVLPVYASVTACYTILPDFIKKITSKYPKIKLSVETGDPAGAITSIKEGRAMLAIGAIPESGLVNLETVSILKTPLIYAAAKNGPYTELEGSPQDILSSTPLILPKTGLARKRFERWIKSRNVKPIVAAESEGNEAILAIAQLGLGIGIVPQIVLESGPYKGEFVIHTAGNILGYYDVGYIFKSEYTGTNLNKKIHEAMVNIIKN